MVGSNVEVKAVGTVLTLNTLVATRLSIEDVSEDAGGAGVAVKTGSAGGLAGKTASARVILKGAIGARAHTAENVQK